MRVSVRLIAGLALAAGVALPAAVPASAQTAASAARSSAQAPAQEDPLGPVSNLPIPILGAVGLGIYD